MINIIKILVIFGLVFFINGFSWAEDDDGDEGGGGESYTEESSGEEYEEEEPVEEYQEEQTLEENTAEERSVEAQAEAQAVEGNVGDARGGDVYYVDKGGRGSSTVITGPGVVGVGVVPVVGVGLNTETTVIKTTEKTIVETPSGQSGANKNKNIKTIKK